MDTAEKSKLAYLKDKNQLSVLRSQTPLPRVTGKDSPQTSSLLLIAERLEFFRKTPLVDHELASALLSFLVQIIQEEVEFYSIKQALRDFLDKFYAESHVRKLLAHICSRILKQMRSVNPVLDDRQSLLMDLQEFVFWYSERLNVVRKFTLPFERSEATALIIDARIDKVNDSSFREGFFVVSDLLVNGFSQKNIWLKVFIREDGEYVNCRSNWGSWIDDTDPLSWSESEDRQRFAVLIPLTPSLDTQIFEDLKCYVPYEALDIRPGRHYLDVEIVACDERGTDLFVNHISAEISMPIGSMNNFQLFSNQSSGVWPVAYSSGDCLDNLQVSHIFAGATGSAQQAIKLAFDLKLVDRVHQQTGLEIRFLTSDGLLIEKAYGLSDNDSDGVIFRRNIIAARIIEQFDDFSIIIPADALDIESDTLDLLCEVTLISEKGQIICGATRRFKYQRPKFTQMRPASDELKVVSECRSNRSLDEGQSSLQIKIFNDWYFDKRPRLRVVLTNSGASNFMGGRYVVSIEDITGQVLSTPDFQPLMQVIRYIPELNSSSLYFNFCYHTVAATSGELFCRIRHFSLDGQLIAEKKEKIPTSLLPAAGEAISHVVPAIQSDLPVRIVDLFLGSGPLQSRNILNVIINTEFAGIGIEPLIIYCDFTNPIATKSKSSPALIKGIFSKLEIDQFNFSGCRAEDCMQIIHPIDLNELLAKARIVSGSVELRVLLCSASTGKLHQAVAQKLEVLS